MYIIVDFFKVTDYLYYIRQITDMDKIRDLQHHNLCTTPLGGTTITSITKIMSNNNKERKNDKD